MKDQAFEGKVAIVTGAGVGIGFEIARRLCASGAAVTLNDADTAQAHAAALLLLSPDAAHITGQSLVVDGGWTSIGASPGEPRGDAQK